MREYDRIADWYAAARNPDVGAREAEALADALPPGARVLDAGCGNGVPIARLLVERGCAVTALDSSAAMVARFRRNVPGVPVQHGRIEDARFAPETFDAVVAWGVLFHLDEASQEEAIQRVATWLRPDGRFLFTAGGTAGVVEGEMNGVVFRYVSLGAEAYRQRLRESGLRLESHTVDAWENDVYVATKRGGHGRARSGV